jgi:Family of unknown function (DUF5677)
MQAANAELVALVRDRLPMRYYKGESYWSIQVAPALTRMADTVDAAMSLMTGEFYVDGPTLLRSLYEQVVTFAWVAVNPGSEQPVSRLDRWVREARYERLKLHNDAVQFRIRPPVLTKAEASAIRVSLGMEDDAGNRLRDKPLADHILPEVPQRAYDADIYWSQKITGLHSARHPLGFRGLYLPAFRVTSQSVHASVEGLDPYITEERNRLVVNRARAGSRLSWALVCPLFGMALMIAAQHVNWIDEPLVRAIVDRGT